MDKEFVKLPGYQLTEAQTLADMLTQIGEIAQELAYITNANLRGLDAKNKSYVGTALGMAKSRAEKDLFGVMMKLRNMREPVEREPISSPVCI